MLKITPKLLEWLLFIKLKNNTKARIGHLKSNYTDQYKHSMCNGSVNF